MTLSNEQASAASPIYRTSSRMAVTSCPVAHSNATGVNNAGGGVIAPTLTHTEETMQATLANNLWTTLRMCRAVLPHSVQRGYGRIISVGAESVRNGLTDHAIYNAALAAGRAPERSGGYSATRSR